MSHSRGNAGLQSRGCQRGCQIVIDMMKAPLKQALSDSQFWWSWGDSNPLPFDCQSNALPIELQPHEVHSQGNNRGGLRQGSVLVQYMSDT